MQRSSRRRFLQQAAVAAGAIISTRLRAYGANDRLNVAAVGCGGKGYSDITSVAASPHVNVVALCDIDESAKHLGKAAEKFPKAERYTDWRRLLEHAKTFDAVTVGIPDHMHAPVSLAAMQLGKHVYCEKPLAHTVVEARQMRRAAEKYGVVTQMGNQGQSAPPYRTAVQLVHDGIIGKVKEVHSWQSRKMGWLLKEDRPAGADAVPSALHWDNWLGVAPARPYKEAIYHPFNWRAWQDFGTGQLGDFGCHILDPIFMALELTAPTTVRAEASAVNHEVWNGWSKVQFVFPRTPRTSGKTLALTWYDGEGRYPPREALGLPADFQLPEAGSVLLGERGTLILPHGLQGMPKLYPVDRFAAFKIQTMPARNHYTSWADACRGADRTTSPFSYAGPLTETVLLGTVAVRVPNETLAWNAADLKFTNSARANALVTKRYRKGWEPVWV
jgi:predicted dehydrogenase